jgi:hypothetical protein
MCFKILFLVSACTWAGTLRAGAREDYLAAAAAQKAGQWAEAAQGYSKVTAQLPKYAPAWKQLAVTRFYLGDFEGAVASADRYLELQPDDAAFAAWTDNTRRKLKLPPRRTPEPTPTPALPTPVPTPESLLLEAPPPGADAQAVTAFEAEQINAQAGGDIAKLEEHNTKLQIQSMTEEAAAVLRRRTPARGRLKPGLRLLGGLGFGLGSFKHGEEVKHENAPSGTPYEGKPAGGFSSSAEFFLLAGESLDFSLGVYPLLWSDNRKSSVTGTLTRSDSSEASATFLPLMVGLAWHQRLSPNFKLFFSAGGGSILSARVHLKEQLAQTNPSGITVTTLQANLDYGPAPAWNLRLGGEWIANPRLSFLLLGQLLGANFADGTGSFSSESRNESGVILASASGPWPPTPLTLMNLNLLAGLNIRF